MLWSIRVTRFAMQKQQYLPFSVGGIHIAVNNMKYSLLSKNTTMLCHFTIAEPTQIL
jgi:hypothetical protein